MLNEIQIESMEIVRQFTLIPILHTFWQPMIQLFEGNFLLIDERLCHHIGLMWKNYTIINRNCDLRSYLLHQDERYKKIIVLIPYENDGIMVERYAELDNCASVIVNSLDCNELKFVFTNKDYKLSFQEENNLFIYTRNNYEEYQYLEMILKAKNGTRKASRTGVYTMSTFGMMGRYSLRDGRFPLLTTKRVFWRAVVEELLWFLRGETSSKVLSEKGIKIWDGNGSKEFLESRGLGHREEGDLGPVYGFQWRRFGAKYIDCHTDYSGQGIDQVNEIIQTLKTDPDSRRMILTAWNPQALNEMALPPCHVMCIFNVLNGELNCMLVQRSADVGLGVPFNIASYALLTRIIAHIVGMKTGELVYITADTHIYENHLQALTIQQERQPRLFPTLKIVADPDLKPEELKIDNFALMDYNPHENISMPMAV